MKLLPLALVSLVFIGSFAIAIGVKKPSLPVIKTYEIAGDNPLPVLTKTNSFPILSAQGALVIDSDSNVTLYEKGADTELYPASTTKIITALVALDYYKPGQVITVIDPTIEGQKMGLVAGEQMTFDNLMNGLLIYSANDAAITLADNYPGGRDSFVNAMNNKIRELHLTHSRFTNPVGLDDYLQQTTARDMIRVAMIGMQNPVFAKIVGTKEATVADVTGKIIHNLTNVNQLLGKVDGVAGIKTGWTEEARENLITYVTRNNHKIYIAILGSADRFGETKELIDWVYGNYDWKEVGFVQKAVGAILK